MLANGWDEAQIFGRNEVDVDTLLLGFADPQESLPVPTWAAKMVNRMLPSATLSIRLASTFLLTKMMRVRFRGASNSAVLYANGSSGSSGQVSRT